MKQINWDELYRKNAIRLKGLCRRYTGDETIADDLVQETFMTAIEKFNTYRGFGSFEGWIRRIAVNKALLYLREKHLTVPLDTIHSPISQEIEMEQMRDKKKFAIEQVSFSTDELLTIIDALPTHHKAVFNLYVIDGYSHRQIGQMMNISAGTSKSHLARARKKAQEMLYQKAEEKQPDENRRRGLWFLFLFQPHHIDKIFRKGLLHFGLPVNTPNFTFPSKTTLTIKWSATLAGKVILFGSSLSVIALGGYMVSQMAQSPRSGYGKPIPTEVLSRSVTSEIIHNDSVVASTKDVDKERVAVKPGKEKVIVKKTIVVRDTVRLER